jgi:hypothetical protein
MSQHLRWDSFVDFEITSLAPTHKRASGIGAVSFLAFRQKDIADSPADAQINI